MKKIREMYRKFRKREITAPQWCEFIATQDKSLVAIVVKNGMDAETRLRAYLNSFHYRMKIRKYCNRHLYTDIDPFEVVRVISPKCVEIRMMDAKQTVFPTDFHPGGFSGHYADNRNQEYEYTSDMNSGVIRIRLGKNGWGNGRYIMSDQPVKFYDYNF